MTSTSRLSKKPCSCENYVICLSWKDTMSCRRAAHNSAALQAPRVTEYPFKFMSDGMAFICKGYLVSATTCPISIHIAAPVPHCRVADLLRQHYSHSISHRHALLNSQVIYLSIPPRCIPNPRQQVTRILRQFLCNGWLHYSSCCLRTLPCRQARFRSYHLWYKILASLSKKLGMDDYHLRVCRYHRHNLIIAQHEVEFIHFFIAWDTAQRYC